MDETFTVSSQSISCHYNVLFFRFIEASLLEKIEKLFFFIPMQMHSIMQRSFISNLPNYSMY